jgi:ubiquinone/menaquinone biosynthesis C-methylase UbiE
MKRSTGARGRKHVTGRGLPRVNYSTIAAYYDKARPAPSDFWISRIISLGKVGPESDVLDVGCGTGRFAIKIARSSGARMCAMDSSIKMLKKALARDRGRRIGWCLGDALMLPFKGSGFDCIYMTMVIHHVESREAALAGILRSLRSGGRCVILTTSHSAIRAHPLRHFPGVVAIDLRRFPSIPALKTAMRRIGFKNVRSSVLKHDEGEISVEAYCKMVRGKYISTLSLLGEEKFEAGFRVFQERIGNLHGRRMRRVLTFNCVVGERL